MSYVSALRPLPLVLGQTDADKQPANLPSGGPATLLSYLTGQPTSMQRPLTAEEMAQAEQIASQEDSDSAEALQAILSAVKKSAESVSKGTTQLAVSTGYEPLLDPEGFDKREHPWLEVSDKTRRLQERINAALKEGGYEPLISDDGKLGPGTCAAARVAFDNLEAPGVRVPTTCESFGTAPTKKSAQPVIRPAVMPPPPRPATAPVPDVVAYSPPKSEFPWLLVLAAVGAVGVVGYAASRKRGKRGKKNTVARKGAPGKR